MIAVTSIACVLCRPTADSELAEVLWRASWSDLCNAIRGGLDAADVLAVSDNVEELRRHAVELLAIRDRIVWADGTDDEFAAAVGEYMAETMPEDGGGRR